MTTRLVEVKDTAEGEFVATKSIKIEPMILISDAVATRHGAI
jgi:hypothetical protein